MSAPATMDAWRISQFGDSDVLTLARVPVPEPGPGECLVRVEFSGVCRHDLLTRSGAFSKLTLPVTLGHQAGGLVTAVGAGSAFAVGDRVVSLPLLGCGACAECRAGDQASCTSERAQFMGDDFDGAYAEFLVAPDRLLVTVPADIPLDRASVLCCTAGTAYHATRTRGAVQPGETVVVTGASGGVGLAAVELAALWGGRVIAITTKPHEADRLRELGATHVIIDADRRFAREVRAITHGRGADIVIEIVGAETLGESLHGVRTGGRIVLVGNLGDERVPIQPGLLILKQISLLASKSCSRAELDAVFELVQRGRLSVHIDDVRPLGDVADVHRVLERNQGSGRIVLATSRLDTARGDS
jgi:acryloyl-coenzyme A reductase